ncbi:Class III cytochrome C family protein [Desulfonauticus submarinus]|uniref:Class III cytochrome C family protein n=1 Tax=Desulfonauticus submarinus TaxID=206665 RepID=A0A1H0DK76_9BACT|nr:cytochrome c3 family protein [Desulfonauticus submarinus]SDN70570.1 Class III cytochrome C family protein [Desulfonauticus submarinus]
MRKYGFTLFGGVIIVMLMTSLCFGATSSAPAKIRKDYHPKPAGWVAKDHVEALKRAAKKYPFVEKVFKEDLILREQRFHKKGIGLKDLKHTYMILNSKLVNTYEDKYGPVKFMHGTHARTVKGNCAICHHYSPADAPDKILPCRSCHKQAFNSKYPERLGLKAAYHQRCIGCHKNMKRGPIGCKTCHLKNVPDHKKIVKLPKNPTPFQVTKECLRCHEDAGREMLTTAHWLWRGPSPYTVNHRKCIHHGKGTDVLNND